MYPPLLTQVEISDAFAVDLISYLNLQIIANGLFAAVAVELAVRNKLCFMSTSCFIVISSPVD